MPALNRAVHKILDQSSVVHQVGCRELSKAQGPPQSAHLSILVQHHLAAFQATDGGRFGLLVLSRHKHALARHKAQALQLAAQDRSRTLLGLARKQQMQEPLWNFPQSIFCFII